MAVVVVNNGLTTRAEGSVVEVQLNVMTILVASFAAKLELKVNVVVTAAMVAPATIVIVSPTAEPVDHVPVAPVLAGLTTSVEAALVPPTGWLKTQTMTLLTASADVMPSVKTLEDTAAPATRVFGTIVPIVSTVWGQQYATVESAPPPISSNVSQS